MLKLYRRHTPTCKHIDKGSKHTKCSCPIWVDGMHNGKRVRHSMDTFNWEEASRKLLELTTSTEKKDSTVADAVKDFITDCESRNLGTATVGKYRETLSPLQLFCEGRSITTIRALADFATLKKFVESLSDSALTKGKKIERLRTFIRHCEDMGWCDNNPARKIKKPKVTSAPVVPFTQAEYSAILEAVDEYPTKNSFGYDNRKRLKAYILMLRYTALRISDVTKLQRSAVCNGRVMLRTLKTGATVHLPLPPAVIEALKEVENGSAFYFWTGNGLLKSAVADWQRSIIRLFKLAKVKGHPHMFRHMMSIELLEKGVPVEHVAQILGNTPNIVYKHYAPWIPARQKALDDAVMSMWA